MTVSALNIGRPFFDITLIENEATFVVSGSAIVLNLAQTPLRVEQQQLSSLQSAIVRGAKLRDVNWAVAVDGFESFDDEAAFCAEVRRTWPSAFDVRKEERLRGVEHYMSPKVRIGELGLSLYHSASVPLKVGLHRDHPFCPVPGFREVHTQLVGFGKMQQCRERDLSTMYLEEYLAPGATHRPMYDSEGNYPWHQFETITPSIFMAVELMPAEAMSLLETTN
ncbi:hypothetical protein N9O95_05165 [Alphaproteobacteria bacterium]|jgi:hypothetical protein|nr:hypothetical protein [Alphaproteobacteria bacterium]